MKNFYITSLKNASITLLVLTVSVLPSVQAQSFAGGTGTEADPYQISNLEQLQAVGNFLDGYFILINDIDASSTSGWNSGAGFEPIGNNSTPFTGSFNGDGHTITGLFISRSGTDYVGLFGRTIGATIQNTGLLNVDITGRNNVGGLVGVNNSSILSNSYSTGLVSGSSNYVGGLVGINTNSSTVSNSYSTGSVSGNNYVGGLVGYNFNSTVSNSYITGSVSGTIGVGGLVGINFNGTVSNSFWDTQTSGQSSSAGGTGKTTAQMQQQATYTGWDFTTLWTIDPARNSGYPFLPVSSPFAGGSGTEADPYQIATVAQLQAIKDFLGSHFKQTNNINASVTSGWNSGAGFEPIGSLSTPFTGSFNGDGHTITGLFISRSGTDYVGLFGRTIGATIQNTGLLNTDITGNNNVGGLVGRNSNSSTVNTSYSTGSVSGDSNVGGLVGYTNSSTLSNSYSTGSVSGNNTVGGLVGVNDNSSILSTSYSTGSVSGSSNVGGLVGVNVTSSTVSNSYSTGSVTGDSNVGGLVGINFNGTVSNSFWDTQTSGQISSAGGTGKTTAQMQQQATYTGWDFTTLWAIDSTRNSGYPFLQVLSETVSNAPVASEVSISGTAEIGQTLTGSYTYSDADGHPEQGSTYQWYRSEDAAGTGKAAIDGATATGYVLKAEDAGAYLSVAVTPKDALDTGVPVESALSGPVSSPFAGGSGTEADPYQIATVAQLQAIKDFLGSHFKQTTDIDASATENWNSGAGFEPIGSLSTPFTGSFNGDGHTITGLFISRSGTDYVGLFGRTIGATIQNTGLLNTDISGNNTVGGLVGVNDNSSILSTSYSTGSVSGSSNVGGLVGVNVTSSTVSNSYSTGSVSGNNTVGGLVGLNLGSTVSNSYSTGSVTVTGGIRVGGLVGVNSNGTVSNSFWDTQTSGQSSSAGGTGKTTAQMQQQATYTGWDFTTLWTIDPARNSGYPFLQVLSGTVGFNPVASAVTVSGTVEIGQTLTAAYTYSDADGHPEQGSTYQWYRSEDAAGTGKAAIDGASSNSYVVKVADAGAYLSVTVTPKDALDTGVAVESTRSGPVLSPFAGGSGTEADPYQIATVAQLQAIKDFLGSHFKQTNNINASVTSGWNSGAGFEPIGSLSTPFTGSFNGDGHTITGLFISRSGTDYVGLFGRTIGATIQNTGLLNADITGNLYVGGLVGLNANSSSLSTSYSTGSVSGNSNVGGLVGVNDNSSILSTSYSTGSVSGSNTVGGLVGFNTTSSTVSNSYSTGSVTGDSNVGGLVGINFNGTVSNSFWDTQTSGQSSSAGGTGKTTAQMQQQATYTGWDFTTLWAIDSTRNSGYPFLQELSETVSNAPVASEVSISGTAEIGQTLTAAYTYSDTDDHPEQGSTYQWYRSEDAAGTGKAAIDGASSNSYVVKVADAGAYLSVAVTPKDALDTGVPVESSLSGPVSSPFAGGSGTEADPFQIATLEQLQVIKDFLDGYFILINDIDASPTATWDDGDGGEPEGFLPIGSEEASFTGHFDGQGYVITGLFINRPARVGVGLFGQTTEAILANIGLEEVSVTGLRNVGALVGAGIVHVTRSYSTGSVRATGSGFYGSGTGGLIGFTYGNIQNCFSSAAVQGVKVVGGLAGFSLNVENSYATGPVTGNAELGGLIGSGGGHVKNSYSTSPVHGSSSGGLVGNGEYASPFDFDRVSLYDTFWDLETSGQSHSFGNGTYSVLAGTGKTTAQMQQQATYTGWDFTTLWAIDSTRNSGYPFLQELSETVSNAPVASEVSISGTAEIGQTLTAAYTYSDTDGHPEQGSTYQWYRSEDAAGTGKAAIDGATATGYVLKAEDAGAYLSVAVTPKDALDTGVAVESALTGPVASLFAGGSGTEADPFQIATLEQLQVIKDFRDKHFILINDIDASSTATWDDGDGGEPEGFAPIGTVSAPFTGHFDGQGYVITGLVINRPVTNYVGLFGFTSIGTVLVNIGLEGGSVTGNLNVGGLVGRYQGSMFSGSYASVDVSGEQSVGGLVGHLYSTISHSYASGAVSGEQNVGGLVGYFEDGNVLDSYATGSVTGERIVGGLVGNNNYGTISKSYATGSVSGEQVVGGLLGANNYGTISDNYWDTETSGTDTGIGNVNVTLPGVTGKTTDEMQQQAIYSGWDFTTLWMTDPTRNSGYPYLQELSETVSNAPVASAVTVSGAAEIGETLTGSYTYNDADGHPEQGSTYQWYRSEDAAGTGKSAIDEATATSYMLTTADASAYLSFSVTPKDHLDTGSSVESALSGPVPSPFAGGSGTEADPYQIATLEQLQAVKDFRDKHFILINDIDASSTATWDDGDGGEPEGFAPIGTVSAPFTGQLDGKGYVIFGLVINRPASSYMGLFGRAAGGASLANIGLEGGSVTGNNNVGGLVGYNSGTISGSYTTGAVTGEQVVGGLVGTNDEGQVSGSYATGSVSGTNYAGGLAGNNTGEVSGSYASGAVTGEQGVGGLVGSNNEGQVSDSYATGFVTGTSSVGGLAGFNNNTISDSYWNTETSGQAASAGGTGKTTAQMQQQATYTGWDFTTLWAIDSTRNSGYPFLQELSETVSNAPVASEVSISGTAEIGQTLTAAYTYSDTDDHPEQGSTYQWYRSEDAAGTGKAAIDGASSNSYVVKVADAGAYLSVAVTPKDILDTGVAVESARTGPVASPFAGGSGTEADPYQIATVAQLQAIKDFLGSHFKQTNNINASVTSGWNSGAGFEPIGNGSAQFTGSFNGDGHTITGLFINRNGTDYVGLFGATDGAAIRNTGLLNAAITGNNDVGGLVGRNSNSSTVSNSYSTGSVVGNNYVGGLVGGNFSSTVSNSYITGSVSGGTNGVGGLVGINTNSSTLSNSYSTGSVSGSIAVGGLVGYNVSSTVNNSYSTASVAGENEVGGLVGFNPGSTVSNSFWDTQTSETETGIGEGTNAGATGKTTAQMQTKSTFTDAGWDFSGVWHIDEVSDGNLSYPYLQNNAQDPPPGFLEVELPTVVTGEEANAITSSSAGLSGEVTDDGNLEVTDRGFVWSEQENPDTGDNVVTAGTGTGSFSQNLSALPPGTQLYVRAYATNEAGTAYGDQVSFSTLQGELTISGSFSALNKVYDGNAEAGFDANSLSLAGVYGAHEVSLDNITLSFAQAGVGTDLVVSLTNAELAGEDAGKYTLTLDGAPTAQANITPLALTLTADSKTKVYGEDDPELSYQLTTGTLIGDDAIAGTLSREEGGSVGNYEIRQGDLNAGGNYAITFEAGELSITPKTLEVTADALTKGYGVEEPTLTYTVSGFELGDDTSILTGTLSREAGESAGTYEIQQGNLSAGDNYAIDFTGAAFIIEGGVLTITADEVTKIYGQADPELTYTATGFVDGDDESVLTGTLSREAGEDVGTYEIRQGDLSAGGNYAITFEVGELSITPKTLDVTADALTKTYGGEEPTLTYTADGFALGDDESVFTGSLEREAGESVGEYAITQGNLSAGDNYAIDFTGAEFTITGRVLTITADEVTKTYGQADPEFTYTVTGFTGGDDVSILTGSLSRAGGEDVGAYEIRQGDLSAGENYAITFEAGELSITPKTLEVAANALTKTYGGVDPTLTYTADGFVLGDDESVFTGSLERESGESAGEYAIAQGNLSAGNNYAIDFTGAEFTITGGVLTITADEVSKTYGQADPELTYTVTGFAEGDDASLLTGSLDREEGEAVGVYAITQGDLSAGENYAITFTGAEFTIAGGVLTISAEDQTKIYGETDPEFTYTVTGFAEGDGESLLTGTLSRKEGESAGTYEIRQGDLSAGENYMISFEPGGLSITPKTLQVTADEGQAKIAGEDDPVLTFTATGFAFEEDESVLSGSLGREEGEAPGEYTITPGDLSAGNNYETNFTGDVFRILRTPPVALSATPEDESALIPVDVQVRVVFDQTVQVANSQLIRLENTDGEATTITPEIEDDRMLVVNHDGLNHLTSYEVIIEAGAIANLDGFGNEEEIRWTFTTIVQAPQQVALISPADSAGSVSIEGVSLQWQEEANAGSYQLALAGDENFGSIIFEEQGLEQTSFSYDGLEYGTVYYWRVRAVNDNSAGPWSDTAVFVTQLRNPQPVFPAHNVDEISIAPFVAWNSEYEDSGYELQISTSSGFGEILVDSLIQDVSFQLTGLKGGTEYHWRVRVIDPYTSSAWSPANSFTTRVDPSEAESVSQNLFIEFGEDRQESASYGIIGLPGVDGLGLDQVIHGTYKKDWRAFTDTGSDDDFLVEYIPEDGRFVFTPGHGFWVFGTQPVTGEYTFTPVTLNEQDGFGVKVHPGWNIISNPYLKSVEWELVSMLNDLTNPLYGFDRQFYTADTLKAFEGYYFYNDAASLLDTLFIPYTGFAQRGLHKVEANTEGMASKITVEVSSPGQGTDKIELVYPQEAGRQGNREDVYHPGIEFSRFGMVLKEEAGNRAMLSRKATSYRSEGDTYELELKSQPSSELKWKVTYSELPDEAGILLVNSVSGESFLMQEDETYTMKSAEPLSRFTMYTGDVNQLEEIRKSLLPGSIELQPNYPNPFNPSTTINYALPEDMQVQLQVFDILGRLVATPVSNRQKAGRHRVLFDGSDLASGVYLYRLQAGKKLLSGKMTLIK